MNINSFTKFLGTVFCFLIFLNKLAVVSSYRSNHEFLDELQRDDGGGNDFPYSDFKYHKIKKDTLKNQPTLEPNKAPTTESGMGSWFNNIKNKIKKALIPRPLQNRTELMGGGMNNEEEEAFLADDEDLDASESIEERSIEPNENIGITPKYLEFFKYDCNTPSPICKSSDHGTQRVVCSNKKRQIMYVQYACGIIKSFPRPEDYLDFEHWKALHEEEVKMWASGEEFNGKDGDLQINSADGLTQEISLRDASEDELEDDDDGVEDEDTEMARDYDAAKKDTGMNTAVKKTAVQQIKETKANKPTENHIIDPEVELKKKEKDELKELRKWLDEMIKYFDYMPPDGREYTLKQLEKVHHQSREGKYPRDEKAKETAETVVESGKSSGNKTLNVVIAVGGLLVIIIIMVAAVYVFVIRPGKKKVKKDYERVQTQYSL